ncbi:CCA tRNA nucleotidyltransferase [Legionella fairfieldensis]|uniref:CCA tRNA nucleotidyltransferase n=1 Tax=Legionella fairfieldensis TaxID=45064 RepID=UPI00048C2766|nr:CCA tRNA nucleotidyltransferase [Legionella fairfieldensis]
MINNKFPSLQNEVQNLIYLLVRKAYSDQEALENSVVKIKRLTDEISKNCSEEEKIDIWLQMGFILIDPFIALLPLNNSKFNNSKFALYLASEYFNKAQKLSENRNFQIENLLDIAIFFTEIESAYIKITNEHLLKSKLSQLKQARNNVNYSPCPVANKAGFEHIRALKALEVRQKYKHTLKEKDVINYPSVTFFIVRLYTNLHEELENFYENSIQVQLSLKNPFSKESENLKNFVLFMADIKKIIRNIPSGPESLTPNISDESHNHERVMMLDKEKIKKEENYQQRYNQEMLDAKNDFLKRRQAQLASKKIITPKVNSTKVKPERNKKIHEKTYEEQLSISSIEEEAYELFKQGNYENAIKKWESLLKKEAYKNRLKQVEINASIGDCYRFWAKITKMDGIELEKKAEYYYLLAQEQITAGLNHFYEDEKWLSWSDFIHMSLNSLKPKNYLNELKKEITKQELTLNIDSQPHQSVETSKHPAAHSAQKKKKNKKKAASFFVENKLTPTEKFIPVNTSSIPSSTITKITSSNRGQNENEVVANIKKLISPSLQAIIDELHHRGHRCYIVGGAVRDAILHKKSTDLDLVSTAFLEEIREIADQLGLKVQIIGAKKPIARIEVGHNEHYDFALLEGPVKPENKHHVKLDNGRVVPIFYGTDIHIDAMNRDCPVNSLYVDLLTNHIEDPTGQGRQDLNNNLLTTIGDPERSFSIDPGRMLRIVRLKETLNFALKEETREAIKNRASLVKFIHPLRFLQELYKLLINEKGTECFNLLEELGLLSLFKTEQTDKNIMPAIMAEIATNKIAENNAWLLILAGLFWPGAEKWETKEERNRLLIKIDFTLVKFADFLWVSNLSAKIKEVWLQSIGDTQQLTSLSIEELSVVNTFEKLIQNPLPSNAIAASNYGNHFFSTEKIANACLNKNLNANIGMGT